MSRSKPLSALGFAPRSVLLVEDHEAMRDAVAELLETDERLSIWGAAGTAEDALELLDEDRSPSANGGPDVAVIDLDLPGMNGLELTGELLRRTPDLPVVVLSSHPADDYEEEALDAGARTYLAKERAAAELVELIHAVLDLPPGRGRPARRKPAPAPRDAEPANPRPRLVGPEHRPHA
jgi:DNA-binding NarL/FixJ family response regulator